MVKCFTSVSVTQKSHGTFPPCSSLSLWATPTSPTPQLFTGSHDGFWRLYDSGNNFTKVFEQRAGAKVNAVEVSNNFLFVAFDAVWDSKTGEVSAGGQPQAGGHNQHNQHQRTKPTQHTVGQVRERACEERKTS